MAGPASSTARPIRRPGLVLALVAVFTVAVLLATTGGSKSPPPPLRTTELPAEGLVESIGVVVHFNYVDTAYGRQAEILSRLRELGVRHIRDAMPPTDGPLATGLQAADREGIRATLATGDAGRDPSLAVADSVRVLGDHIDAFEGPNELDNSGDPNWPAKLRAYMPALEAAARRQTPGLPVIGPSFIRPADRRQLPPDLPGLLNGHPYPGGAPPEPVLGSALRELPTRARREGVVFTETGYHNALQATGGQPPASEEAAAVYLPRLLLTAFGAGVRRTFIYELLDETPEPGLADSNQHFGLVRNDLSPKPAFTAIQTLIAALQASPGAGRREPLRWGLRGDGSGDVQRLTLARRDGSRVIALWRPVSVWDERARLPIEPQALRIELSFGRRAHDVAIWRPSVSAQPVLRREAVRRLALELGGDLVLVSLR